MRVLLLFLIFLFGEFVFAQNMLSDGELMRVNNRSVSSEEFEWVFTKNASIIQEEDQIGVDEYFDLFKKYQLKLEAARELELDKDSVFQKEYKKYYKQLADNYIANGEVTENMIEETYQRLVNEVKASHILISPKPNSGTEGWEEAFNKAIQIKKQLDDGEDFELLARNHSDDPSVRVNGGNMGWFKAFKMVYPFEDATYKLDLDSISDPVQTQFGYHIIKKTGERESVGKLKVAHIMIRMQQEDTTQNPKTQIENIYQKIQSGEDFGDLAKQFSQDQNSASKGGEMAPFEIGDINSQKFTEEAFSLTEDGQVSQPFETRFGWHIVKRLETIPPASYEEQKETLKRKIKTSDRSRLLNARIQEKIEEQYDVAQDNEAINYISTLVDKDVFKGKWKLAEDHTIPEEVFLQIDEQTHSWLDLAMYVEKQQRGAKNKNSLQALVEELANNFVYAQLIEYHKVNLPNLDPEFAESLKEYKDGLLLYEVMEKEVWKPAKEDTIALKQFYVQNASKYKTEETVEVESVSFSNKKQAKKFLKKVKNQEDFSTKANASTVAVFQPKENKKTKSSSVTSKLKLKKGISKIYKHNGQYVVYNIHEVQPVRQLEYQEIKGRVISDYQEQLEKKWLDTLKSKFTVVVNDAELDKLRKRLE